MPSTFTLFAPIRIPFSTISETVAEAGRATHPSDANNAIENNLRLKLDALVLNMKIPLKRKDAIKKMFMTKT